MSGDDLRKRAAMTCNAPTTAFKLRVSYTFALLAAAYFLSRLYHLKLIPPISDESQYIIWAVNRWLAPFYGETKILTIALYALVMPLVSDQLWVGRFISVLCGFGALWATYEIARAQYGRTVAVITGLIFIATPLGIFFNRFARWESVQAMLGTLVLLQACRFARKPSAWNSIGIGLWLLLSILVNISALSFTAVPFLAVLALRSGPLKAYRKLGIAYLFIGPVLGLALFPTGYGQGLSAVNGLPQRVPTIEHGLWSFVLQIAQISQANAFKIADWIPALITPTILAAAGAGVAVLAKRRDATAWLWPAICGVYLAPLVFGARILFPHYLLFLAAPVSLMAACGVAGVAAGITRKRQSLLAGVAAVFTVAALVPALAFDARLLQKPETLKLPRSLDIGFLSEWPSGYGTYEIYERLDTAAVASRDGARAILFAAGDGVNLGLRLLGQRSSRLVIEQRNLMDKSEFALLRQVSLSQPTFVVMDDPPFVDAVGTKIDASAVLSELKPVLRVYKPGGRRSVVLYEVARQSPTPGTSLFAGFGQRKIVPRPASFPSPWNEPTGIIAAAVNGTTSQVLVTIAPYEVWLPMIADVKTPAAVSLLVNVSEGAPSGAEAALDFVCGDRRITAYREFLNAHADAGQRGWQQRVSSLPGGIDGSCWAVFRALPGRNGDVTGAWISWANVTFRTKAASGAN